MLEQKIRYQWVGHGNFCFSYHYVPAKNNNGIAHRMAFSQSTGQIMALLWLGMIGSGLCLYLYFYLIKNAGAVFASMVTYLMTITGVIAGVVLLRETLSYS